MRTFGFRARQVAATVAVAVVVALVTGVISATLLVRSGVHNIRESAELTARTVYHQTGAVIRENWSTGFKPAIATDPALRRIAESIVGFSPTIVYVAVLDDSRHAIFHSDTTMQGRPLPPELSLTAFSERNPFVQAWMLCTRSRVLALDLPFKTQDEQPLGSVRVAVSTLLLKKQLMGFIVRNAAIAAAVVVLAFTVSFWVADRMLAPVERLRTELARVADLELDLRTEGDASRIAALFSSMARELSRREAAAPSGKVAIEEDGVALLAQDGRLLHANPTAARLLGSGVLHAERLAADHPLRAVVSKTSDTAADAATRGRERVAWENGDGTVVVSVRAQRLPAGNGPAATLLTLRDADMHSRLRAELAHSRKLGAVGRITSGVTHEIKNALNAIVMHAEVMRRKLGEDDAELTEAMAVLEKELRRLDRIVETHLQFTRPEELVFETVDLGGVIDDALELVGARLRSAGVDVERRAPAEPVSVGGDAELLRQAFVNLMLNACDAMPAGGTLTLTATTSRDDRSVQIEVADTGVGIDPERLEKVFDLFHSTKPGGSGIGLSTVYRVVHLHGGSIRVESEPNRGTCFTLVFPTE